jgi:hypothetical protein
LVIDAFRGWLPGVPQFENPDLMRLYRWECGSWLTLTQLEFDIAWKDILTPFNNRLLLTTMLSLDERLRCGPRFSFFEDLMRRLWPDVLTEPFPEVKLHFLLSPERVRRVVRQLRERFPSRRLV